MDTYGGGMGVLWVAIFEMAAIMWIYGVGRFSSDLKFMLESNVSWYWKITWSVAPVILGRKKMRSRWHSDQFEKLGKCRVDF